MSSSSSSSDDSSAGKNRGKKSKEKKKGKKDKKKPKKADKKSKKADKKAARAEAWECDRQEAVRLLKQLLQLDAGIGDELRAVFESVDSGDVVRIDGLECKQAKKKLRHLLQALKLAPADGQGFRTASKKVSFLALFQSCLAKALEGGPQPTAPAPAPPSPTPPAAVAGPAVVEVEVAEASTVAAPLSPPPLVAAAPDAAPARRRVGPQLPMPGVGPGGPAEDESDEEDGEEGAGPRGEGEERQGVDLDSMPQQLRREAWMTTPHESIAAAFGEGGRPRKADKYEVRRTKEEQEAFEKMFRDRGPSLLQECAEQKFAGNEEDLERVRKRKVGAPDVWGLSAKEQERSVHGAAAGMSSAPKRPFDPETDLRVLKPITKESFSQLVDSSVEGLAGRFSRGQVATSFL